MANNNVEPIHQRKVTFDPTINLGHILTFLGLLVAGAGGWMAMDKRVTVLEANGTAQHATDVRQDAELQDTKKSVRDDLRDISSKLDRLIERNGK